MRKNLSFGGDRPFAIKERGQERECTLYARPSSRRRERYFFLLLRAGPLSRKQERFAALSREAVLRPARGPREHVREARLESRELLGSQLVQERGEQRTAPASDSQ